MVKGRKKGKTYKRKNGSKEPTPLLEEVAHEEDDPASVSGEEDPLEQCPPSQDQPGNKRKRARTLPLESEDGEEDFRQEFREDRGAGPRIPPAMKEHLTEWFRDHPLFFDQTLTDFKNKSKKDRLLEEKLKELGISSIRLSHWWRNMRTCYGKLRKKKSGQASTKLTARGQWTLRCLSFLDTHIQVQTETRHFGQVPQPTLISELAETDRENEEEVAKGETSQAAQEPSTSHQPPPKQQKSGKAKSLSQTADEALIRMANTIAKRPSRTASLQALSQETNDSRVAYCHWFRTESRDMTEEQWMALLGETTAMLMRFRNARTQATIMPPVISSGMYGFQPTQRPPAWTAPPWQPPPGSSQVHMNLASMFGSSSSHPTPPPPEGQRIDNWTWELVTAANNALTGEEGEEVD